MKTMIEPTYEVRLYIGCREQYNGATFSRFQLLKIIGEYQKTVSPTRKCSLRVTDTCFIVEDYQEFGWEITAIQYPRFPKPIEWIEEFMHGLACHLLVTLNQNRISVISPDKTVLYETDDAKEGPTK